MTFVRLFALALVCAACNSDPIVQNDAAADSIVDVQRDVTPNDAPRDVLSDVRADAPQADSATDDGGDGGDAAQTAPTWTEVYGLLTNSCGGCHGGSASAQPQWLEGTATEVHTRLTTTSSVGAACTPAFAYVTPGDPNTSLLVSKTEETTPDCGNPMPRFRDANTPWAGAPRLRAWIQAGALNN